MNQHIYGHSYSLLEGRNDFNVNKTITRVKIIIAKIALNIVLSVPDESSFTYSTHPLKLVRSTIPESEYNRSKERYSVDDATTMNVALAGKDVKNIELYLHFFYETEHETFYGRSDLSIYERGVVRRVFFILPKRYHTLREVRNCCRVAVPA